MNTYSYRISLRARHPKEDLSFLSNLLGKQPKYSWVAGEPRYDSKGQELSGKRSVSYWSASMTPEKIESETCSLEEYLEKCLGELSPFSKALSRFVAAQGTLEFFVGLFANDNFGVVLPTSLLAQLGAANIELQFDIYPI